MIAATMQERGHWINPRRNSTKVPRLPKILPFLVQQYKVNNIMQDGQVPRTVTRPASRWVRTLVNVVREAYTDYENAVDDYIMNLNIKRAFRHPALTTADAEHMVVPFLFMVEPIIQQR